MPLPQRALLQQHVASSPTEALILRLSLVLKDMSMPRTPTGHYV